MVNRQQERNEHTRRIIEAAFDEIIRLVETGVPMVKAITYVPGKPTLNAVRNWMRNNPDQYQRFKDAQVAACGSTGHSPYSAAAWESALVTMETSDEPLSQIKRQGEPGYDVCLQRSKRDPVFGAKFDAAIARRNARPDRRPARFNAEAYERALQILRENPDRPMGELEAELVRLRLPKLGAIYSAKYAKDEIARQFAEISASRGVRRYSPEQHEQALAILKADPAAARSLLKQAAGRLPSFGAIASRAKHNAEFAAIFEEVRELRSEAYQRLWAEARTNRRITKARRRREAKPRYQDNMLKSGLLLDQLYAEASRLFHQAIDDRDDMISEVVLAVLQGDISRDEIKSRGVRIGKSYSNRFFSKKADSLDRPYIRGEPGSGSFGDMLTSDHWTLEDAI